MNRISILSIALLAIAACSTPQDKEKDKKQEEKPKQQTKQALGWDQPAPLCTLNTEIVNESSGVAPSHERPNLYYTHNDSGDGPRFFKFNSKGEVLATYTLKGEAKAIDWEDMASARIKEQSYLYLGDIGDNAAKRKNVVVYRLKEPEPHAPGGAIASFDIYTITYPDGAHDAEALMIHPQKGDIYIVTKTSKGDSQVFKLDAPKASGSYTMKEMGKFKVGQGLPFDQLITSADIAPDASRVVLRTYMSAYEYKWSTKLDDWFKSKPTRIMTAMETQGEAICYSADAKSLVTTSEGMPCPVSVIKRKGSF